MDIKLESLIERIKQDGIEEAKKTSEEIIESAKKEALKIINKAEQEAEKIVNSAKEETEKLKDNASAVVKQAGRDLMLAVKEQLGQLFDKIVKSSLS